MILTLNRRIILAGAAGLAAPRTLVASQATIFYRNPDCGCCEVWSKLMAEAGMPVEMRDSEELDVVQQSMGVPEDLRGCHAGKIDGFVISGHLPPSDIKRLLTEKPTALGLAVPGMPMGSPGMETESTADPYDVMLFRADGTREVFARYV